MPAATRQVPARTTARGCGTSRLGHRNRVPLPLHPPLERALVAVCGDGGGGSGGEVEETDRQRELVCVCLSLCVLVCAFSGSRASASGHDAMSLSAAAVGSDAVGGAALPASVTATAEDTPLLLPPPSTSTSSAAARPGQAKEPREPLPPAAAAQRAVRDERDRRARRKLATSSALCFVFMLAEIAGGYFAGSLAIMTDASHLLSDLTGFIISLVALHMGQQPATRSLSYGYARAEVLGAFMSIVLIWALTAVLVVEAVRRLLRPEPVDGRLMFIMAALGIVVNVFMGLVLGHEHDHTHAHHQHDAAAAEHGHAHGDLETHGEGGRADRAEHAHHEHANANAGGSSSPKSHHRHHSHMGENVNVRAAFLHVIGDLVQSVGVMIAAVVVWWRPELRAADPICTLLFSVIVLVTTLRMIGETVQVLMEGTPRNINLHEVYASLVALDGVVEVQDLHVWSLTVGRPALSAKLRSDSTVADAHRITMAAEQACRARFGIEHTTIQVNCVDPACCPRLGHADCLSPENGMVAAQAALQQT